MHDFPLWDQLPWMHSRTLATTRSTLHVVESQPNRSPDVLLMHGVLRNWRSFYPLLPLLHQTQLAVASFDFRGHGESTNRPNQYRVIEYVDDAQSVLETLDKPVVLVGHSLGAMVAMAAAARMPDRVRSLIMEDPPFETMGSKFVGTAFHRYFLGVHECVKQSQSNAAHLFEDFSNIVVGTKQDGSLLRVRDQRDENSRRFSVDCLKKTDPSVLESIVSGQWLSGFDWRGMISQLQCDVHLLQSDSLCGGMLSDDDVSILIRGLGRRCHFNKFEGVGHTIHWQAAPTILQLILAATTSARASK